MNVKKAEKNENEKKKKKKKKVNVNVKVNVSNTYSNSELLKILFHGDQEIIQGFVKDNIKSVECNGNFYNIRYPNAPVFIAHMDTVGEKTMNKKLKYEAGILSRPGYVLGADDRAGVWIILTQHKNINWILCKDEEVGALGSRALIKDQKFLTRWNEYTPSCGVVLDRKGTDNIIGVDNAYCKEDLERMIQKLLPSYVPDVGTFSDADTFNELVPCVNLSVGYENAHTNREYLDVKHMNWLRKQIPALHEGLTGEEFDMPELYPDYYEKDFRYGSVYPTATGYCDICGETPDIEVEGLCFCYDCAEHMKRELTNELLKGYY